ncbi:MAG: diacylglycerol kinase family lipid kinase [Lachnospiraceae bacterium]|nr:diacylglycerol kinase family lipid kinase [Lachnospiraceae bacterium]
MKLQFIVNPASKTGRGIEIWQEVEKVLKGSEIEYEVYYTKRIGHGTELARKLTESEGEHMIVALGGDGTVNEVVNGIVRIKDTILGYIPTGSGNDLAGGLGLPTDPMTSIEHILENKSHLQVNIGVVEVEGMKRRFAVSSGMGWDAAICHEVAVSKLKKFLNKIKLGKLSYVAIAVKQIFAFKTAPMEIQIDGKAPMKFQKNFFSAVMNSPYEGGRVMMCPAASWSDDLLDICIVDSVPKLKLLLVIPLAYKGWHKFFKGVHIKRGEKMTLRSAKPLPMHVDGENFGYYTEAVMYLEKEKLRIIR